MAMIAEMMPSDNVIGNLPPKRLLSHTIFNPTKISTTSNSFTARNAVRRDDTNYSSRTLGVLTCSVDQFKSVPDGHFSNLTRRTPLLIAPKYFLPR